MRNTSTRIRNEEKKYAPLSLLFKFFSVPIKLERRTIRHIKIEERWLVFADSLILHLKSLRESSKNKLYYGSRTKN